MDKWTDGRKNGKEGRKGRKNLNGERKGRSKNREK
jgi:hypothetical protein